MESIRHFTGPTLISGATIARVSRLYVPTWSLFDVYKQIEENHYQTARMTIVYVDAMPIAVAVYLPKWWESYDTVMAFCRQSWRQKGLATKCVMALALPKQVHAAVGISGSERLWQACRILHITGSR